MIYKKSSEEEIFGKGIDLLIHDLRNYLNTIIGLSSLLKEEAKLNDEQFSLLNKIFFSGVEIQELLSDIDFYMLDDCSFIVEKKERFDPVSVIKEFFETKKDVLKELKIELHLFNNCKSEIDISKEIFRRILNNLLKTSIKGVRNQSERNIYIFLKIVGDELWIIYSDTSPSFFIENSYFNLNEVLQAKRGLGIIFLEKYVISLGGKISYLYGNNWINFINEYTSKIKSNHGFKILLPIQTY